MKKLGKRTAYILMIGIVLIWGVELIIGKTALAVLTPTQLACARFVISSFVMFILMKKLDPGARLRREDIPLMIVAALVGLVIYYWTEYQALNLISPSLVSIILGLMPIISLVIEKIFYSATITPRKAVSVLLSIVGVIVVITNGQSLNFAGDLMGYLLAFVSVICWAASNYILLALLDKYSPVALNFYRQVIGAFAFLLLSLSEPIPFSQITPQVLLCILFLGTICSGCVLFLYSWTIQSIGALPLAVFGNMMPVTTILMSFLFLKERLTMVQLGGTALILISVFMIIDYKGLQTEEQSTIQNSDAAEI